MKSKITFFLFLFATSLFAQDTIVSQQYGTFIGEVKRVNKKSVRFRIIDTGEIKKIDRKYVDDIRYESKPKLKRWVLKRGKRKRLLTSRKLIRLKVKEGSVNNRYKGYVQEITSDSLTFQAKRFGVKKFSKNDIVYLRIPNQLKWPFRILGFAALLFAAFGLMGVIISLMAFDYYRFVFFAGLALLIISLSASYCFFYASNGFKIKEPFGDRFTIEKLEPISPPTKTYNLP